MKTSFPRHQLGTESRSPAWSEYFINSWSCFSMSRSCLHMHTLVYVCVSWHLLAFVFSQSVLLFDGIMSVISHLQIVIFTRFCVSLWLVCGFVHFSAVLPWNSTMTGPTRSAVAAGGSFMNGPHFAEILPEMISSWLETLRHARALHATPAAWLGQLLHLLPGSPAHFKGPSLLCEGKPCILCQLMASP